LVWPTVLSSLILVPFACADAGAAMACTVVGCSLFGPRRMPLRPAHAGAALVNRTKLSLASCGGAVMVMLTGALLIGAVELALQRPVHQHKE
jgi:hypothetical protein